jgi:hypothetical protein
MTEDVPPDLIGQMATVGTTRMPLGMCESCSRGLIYGLIAFVGSVKGEVQTAYMAVEGGQTGKALQTLEVAENHAEVALSLLIQFVQADFDSCVAAGTHLDADEYHEAVESFLRSRMDHYVTDAGEILFEEHEEPAR